MDGTGIGDILKKIFFCNADRFSVDRHIGNVESGNCFDRIFHSIAVRHKYGTGRCDRTAGRGRGNNFVGDKLTCGKLAESVQSRRVNRAVGHPLFGHVEPRGIVILPEIELQRIGAAVNIFRSETERCIECIETKRVVVKIPVPVQSFCTVQQRSADHWSCCRRGCGHRSG